MKRDTLFLDEISRIEKLFLMGSLKRTLLIALACFFCMYTLVAGMGKVGFSPFEKYGAFYIIAAGICLVFSLLHTCLKREKLSNRLIDIDGRLNLKDRLSTAYEYHKSGKKSGFADLLIADAGKRLGNLSKKQIVPPKRSFVHFLLGILILLNIIIPLIGRSPHRPEQDRIDPETLNKMNSMLKKYASSQNKDAPNTKRPGFEMLKKKTADIAKMLSRPMGRDRLHTSLRRMLKEIQSEKMLLAKSLAKKLDDENIQDGFIQKIPQFSTLSLYHLKKLKRMLNKLFDNRIPDAIAGRMADLDEHHSLEKFMEQIIDHLDDAETHRSDEDDSRAGGPDDPSGKKTDSDKNRRFSKENPGNRSQSDTQKEGGGARDPELSGKGENVWGDSAGREGDEEFEEGGSSSAGRGKAENRPTASYGLDKQKGPAIQDRTISSQKQDYSFHIRSLTAIGDAKVKNEDIFRPYRQELEAILQKEDIPLNYREYIKNYFLSIGLRKEADK